MDYETSIHNEEGSEDLIQLVVFQLGGEEFGVDIMQVQEIIRIPETTRIPRSPDYIKGVINLRGRIIVVINLDQRFGMDSKEIDDNSRIIVAEVGETVMGMVVDSVSEVMRLPASNLEPAPDILTSRVSSDYIRGVGKLEDRLLILLDLEKVLSEKEIEQVATISKMHR